MVKPHCSQCSKKCVGDVLKVGEKYFHQYCFKCKDCNSALDTGGFFLRDSSYYCPKDYTKRFSNKCFICSNIIDSEVVSALNHHFHRNCFKCNICSKIFSPGDRVTMKGDRFVCNTCISNQAQVSKEVNGHKANEDLSPKDILSDDLMTDQGYISADPTSLIIPSPRIEEEKEVDLLSKMSESRSKSRSSLTRSLFDFGKFYKSSYLDIQELREKEKQSRPNKDSRTLPWHFSSNFHLPLSNNYRHGKRHSNKSTISSAISCSLVSRCRKLTSVSESEVNEIDEVVRLSSYPAGEKPPKDIPIPLERDDWPAPLSTAVLMREKIVRRRDFFELGTDRSGDQPYMGDVVDYTQSLNYLPSVTPESQHRTLTEVIENDQHDLNGDIISASRSPNARMEPTSRPRYKNHSDKSKSRNSAYFNDPQRHNGYSLEVLSSTTRPLMAGKVPYEISGGRVDRSPCNSFLKSKPGYTQGLLHERKNQSSTKPLEYEINNMSERGIHSSNTQMTSRNMSSNFEISRKKSDHENTFGERLYYNQDDLSYSEIDLLTGLKIIKNRYGKERVIEETITSDKFSINSKIKSLGTSSFRSNRPISEIKSYKIPYADLISKDPKIMRSLDSNRLETYLSLEEFHQLFKLIRSDFYRLPEWKQNDLKRRVKLF